MERESPTLGTMFCLMTCSMLMFGGTCRLASCSAAPPLSGSNSSVSSLVAALEAVERSVATGSPEEESGPSVGGFAIAGEELAEKPWGGLGKSHSAWVFSLLSFWD